MTRDAETALGGTAAQGRPTPLSAPAKKLPIIIVPGVMGTRLSADNGELVWNPKSEHLPLGKSPGPFVVNTERLADMRPLRPDVRHGYDDPAKNSRAAKVKRFNNLITDYYGDLCFALAEELEVKLRAAKKNVIPKVYCAGYDWRQDNAESAQLLAKRVAEARRECEGEPCILIAHSMGGLVARYYCRWLQNAQDGPAVRALFLLGSPSLGAVKPYVWLKEGIAGLFDMADFALKRIALGLGQRQSRDLLRQFNSAYQLAPSRTLGASYPWLDFDAEHTAYPLETKAPVPVPILDKQFSSAAVPSKRLYEDLYVGLNDASARDRLTAGRTLAEDFHKKLAIDPDYQKTVYMPSHTYCVYATQVDTLREVRVNFKSVTGPKVRVVSDLHLKTAKEARAPRNGDVGDGSVPAESANPEATSAPFAQALKLGNVEHSDIPNNRDVIEYIMAIAVALS